MMIGTMITMMRMMKTSHDPLVVRQVLHLVQVVLRRVLVHQIHLLKRRKRRKTRVGWSIIEPMMMEPNGRKAKMRHGTTENPVKAIGLSGRTR